MSGYINLHFMNNRSNDHKQLYNGIQAAISPFFICANPKNRSIVLSAWYHKEKNSNEIVVRVHRMFANCVKCGILRFPRPLIDYISSSQNTYFCKNCFREASELGEKIEKMSKKAAELFNSIWNKELYESKFFPQARL